MCINTCVDAENKNLKSNKSKKMSDLGEYTHLRLTFENCPTKIIMPTCLPFWLISDGYTLLRSRRIVESQTLCQMDDV